MKKYKRIRDLREVTKSKSAFLLGPRQTGKTSLIREQLAGVPLVDLLRSEIYLEYQRNPEKLRNLPATSGSLVVIDEIQRVPALLNEVHYLIEEKNWRFLLTGSSARKLRKEGVNLLGGRARNYSLFPLTSSELAEDFSLEKALHVGSIPSIYLSDEPRMDLSSYVENYLRLEISSEALTRNLPAFSRFLEVAALSNTKVLNYAKIANDAQIAPSTAREYFQILKDTLMGTSLPVWQEGVKRKASSTAKFYFFDIGVVNAIINRWAVQENTIEFGEALEAFIFCELNSYTSYNNLAPLTFWRSQQKDEVDFILNGNVAIEVKAKNQISSREIKSLLKLKEENAQTRFVLVCQTPIRQTLNGIDLWPIKEFLEALWQGEFLT